MILSSFSSKYSTYASREVLLSEVLSYRLHGNKAGGTGSIMVFSVDNLHAAGMKKFGAST
jgi:hypothetical protein